MLGFFIAAFVILLFAGFLGLRLALTVIIKVVKVLILFLIVLFILSLLFGWPPLRESSSSPPTSELLHR